MPSILNRYTSLPSLLDILQRKQITLLSPSTWADRNDSHFLERYQEERSLKSVLALCFSTRPETFHHWQVFAEGASGVCLQFNAEIFLAGLKGIPGLRMNWVRYEKVIDLEKQPPPTSRWPFVKRIPYEDEAEFRLVYEDRRNKTHAHSIDFDIESLERITLSPWMPLPVADSVMDLMAAIPGCSGIYMNRSTLIENSRWRRVIAKP